MVVEHAIGRIIILDTSVSLLGWTGLGQSPDWTHQGGVDIAIQELASTQILRIGALTCLLECLLTLPFLFLVLLVRFVFLAIFESSKN